MDHFNTFLCHAFDTAIKVYLEDDNSTSSETKKKFIGKIVGENVTIKTTAKSLTTTKPKVEINTVSSEQYFVTEKDKYYDKPVCTYKYAHGLHKDKPHFEHYCINDAVNPNGDRASYRCYIPAHKKSSGKWFKDDEAKLRDTEDKIRDANAQINNIISTPSPAMSRSTNASSTRSVRKNIEESTDSKKSKSPRSTASTPDKSMKSSVESRKSRSSSPAKSRASSVESRKSRTPSPAKSRASSVESRKSRSSSPAKSRASSVESKKNRSSSVNSSGSECSI